MAFSNSILRKQLFLYYKSASSGDTIIASPVHLEYNSFVTSIAQDKRKRKSLSLCPIFITCISQMLQRKNLNAKFLQQKDLQNEIRNMDLSLHKELCDIRRSVRSSSEKSMSIEYMEEFTLPNIFSHEITSLLFLNLSFLKTLGYMLYLLRGDIADCRTKICQSYSECSIIQVANIVWVSQKPSTFNHLPTQCTHAASCSKQHQYSSSQQSHPT